MFGSFSLGSVLVVDCGEVDILCCRFLGYWEGELRSEGGEGIRFKSFGS